MELWQALLIGMLSFVKKIDHKGPQIAIYNCMFWGVMAGLIMGDVRTGLVIGGTFQLMALGVTSIGGSSVPDYQAGAIISTAIAVSTGQGPEMGITIGLPVAIACIQLDVLQNLLDGWLVRKAQDYCRQGEFKKMNRMLWLCIPGTGLSTGLPAFLAAAFGPEVVEWLLARLPSWLLPGLNVAGGILPVCGIASLLLYMPTKKYFEFLLIGFVLSAYLQLPILAVVIVGIGFAHMVYKQRMKEEWQQTLGEPLKEMGSKAGAAVSSEREPKLTLKDLRRAGFRCNQTLISFNYENQMAGGLVYAIAPALRNVYPDDKEYGQALENHFRFFNVTPYLENFLIGMILSMEDRGGISSQEAIQNMKVGLMGAVTGVGDSIFYVLIPTIFGSVGGYMAVEGNPVGMAAWLIYGLVFFLIRPYFVEIAYRQGWKLMGEFESRISVIADAAAALGLMVAGSMISTVVTIQTPLRFTFGEVSQELQTVLDEILPSLLPLLCTAGVMVLLKKKAKLTRIILLILVLSCILTALGVLG